MVIALDSCYSEIVLLMHTKLTNVFILLHSSLKMIELAWTHLDTKLQQANVAEL